MKREGRGRKRRRVFDEGECEKKVCERVRES